MNKLEKLSKLRQMTQEKGASEAEERTAAEMIGKILMQSPEIRFLEPGFVELGTVFKSQSDHRPDPFYRAMQEALKAALAQQQQQQREWNIAQMHAQYQRSQYQGRAYQNAYPPPPPPKPQPEVKDESAKTMRDRIYKIIRGG